MHFFWFNESLHCPIGAQQHTLLSAPEKHQNVCCSGSNEIESLEQFLGTAAYADATKGATTTPNCIKIINIFLHKFEIVVFPGVSGTEHIHDHATIMSKTENPRLGDVCCARSGKTN